MHVQGRDAFSHRGHAFARSSPHDAPQSPRAQPQSSRSVGPNLCAKSAWAGSARAKLVPLQSISPRPSCASMASIHRRAVRPSLLLRPRRFSASTVSAPALCTRCEEAEPALCKHRQCVKNNACHACNPLGPPCGVKLLTACGEIASCLFLGF